MRTVPFLVALGAFSVGCARADPISVSDAAKLCIQGDLRDRAPPTLRPCLDHETAECRKRLAPFVEQAEVVCGKPNAVDSILK